MNYKSCCCFIVPHNYCAANQIEIQVSHPRLILLFLHKHSQEAHNHILSDHLLSIYTKLIDGVAHHPPCQISQLFHRFSFTNILSPSQVFLYHSKVYLDDAVFFSVDDALNLGNLLCWIEPGISLSFKNAWVTRLFVR